MNKKNTAPKSGTNASRKRSAKKAASNPSLKMPSFELRRDVKGFLLLAFSMALLLSLLSFSYNGSSRNLLGAFGNTLGWLAHAFFGLGSYFMVVFLVWSGWRCFFDKNINRLKTKLAAFFILVSSFCLLMAFVEETFPNAAKVLGEWFYPSFWLQKKRFHLSGAPFYFVYRDLPFMNVHHTFNSLGAALIFSTTFFASLFYLCKIQPKNILEQWLMQPNTPQLAHEGVSGSAPRASQKNSDNKELEKINPFRFVKVRIPFANWGKEDDSKAPQQLLPQEPGSTQDLLAIKPETNLKERPSISGKGSNLPESKLAANGSGAISASSPQIPAAVPAATVAAVSSTTANERSSLQPKELKEIAKTAARHLTTAMSKRDAALAEQRVHNGDFSEYKLPQPNMLSNAKKVEQSQLKQGLRNQAEVLEETLHSFGIEAKVGQINCGPTITSFEVHPAIGVKVQKIKALESDIALNLEAKSIRIIAPIPGKAAVGIEVPNASPQEVSFKEMLQAYQQSQKKFHIPILLGKAVNGDYVMSDLAKMPHCIIAGATGSGKSVCINTIVMSILLNARPDQIKLLMVDPKKVELTPYSRLPHMLAPVICEPKGACAALQWLVKEMEKRYDILKLIGVRNIEAFNTRTIQPESEKEMKIDIPVHLPYIVCIIDELADLMMVASNDIETYIARIAQMARAVGIHLILATQRPSREVITGLIKANFPTRIAFKVASRINSQIILDETGAETLLGNGDMLFLPPASSTLVRAQGAFIRDEDINKVIESICRQSPPNYLIESFDDYDDGDNANSTGHDDDDAGIDPLFKQAKQLLLDNGNISTTFIQRKLKIGYARAASLMDELQGANLLQPPTSPAKGRKLALPDDSFDL